MKLFDDFDVVRFSEENLLFVTRDEYLYYICNPECQSWRKYKNAGNDSITVCNYQNVKKEEIIAAMHGVFPKKETDFMRLCDPSQLCIRDMLDLLKEDYPEYMSDREIYHTVHRFLIESDICHVSFLKSKQLLTDALAQPKRNEAVLVEIKKLCLTVIGRDIFKPKIGIVDGHNGSLYFWIMPVRIVDDTDTNDMDAVAEMKSVEISIEENDVYQYLTPFLDKYFDDELDANKKRVNYYWEDNDGNECPSYVSGFDWNLTYNFYSFDAVANILNDIKDTADGLSCGKPNEYTANRPTKYDADVELIIDFYRRFIYRMEYMMTVGKEKGYNLISFMGP